MKHRARPKKGSCILLVDDDDLIRGSVGNLLSHLGFLPEFACTGEEALAKLEEGLQPSLVILDMDMPGLGGAATFPLIRLQRPQLPVVISTGRIHSKVTELVQNHTQVMLLPKPFGLQELRELLS